MSKGRNAGKGLHMARHGLAKRSSAAGNNEDEEPNSWAEQLEESDSIAGVLFRQRMMRVTLTVKFANLILPMC